MLKLFTLENLSAASADAVYKICLTMEEYGLTQDNVGAFESYEAMFNAALYALEDGDDLLLAAENEDFNAVKHVIFAKLALDAIASPQIATQITAHYDLMEADFDVDAHCAVPLECDVHLSEDGLFSGFTVRASGGTLTVLPLDFDRMDAELASVIRLMFAPEEEAPAAVIVPELNETALPPLHEEMPTQPEFVEPVTQMLEALSGAQEKICLVHGPVTDWIYELRDTLLEIEDTVDFAYPQEETEADLQESASARLLRQAKQARQVSDAAFGAAISEMYSNENDGNTVYYAYVAIADRETAKAKRINTTNPDDLALLLPHCVTVLCETVCKKLAEAAPAEEAPATEEKKGKKVSKGVIIFAVIVLIAAIATPIALLKHFVFTEPTSASDLSLSSTAAPGALTTVNIGGDATTTTQPSSASLPAGNNLTPAEPGASDVSAATTTTSAPSTSGTFTFYVFGYGHGVGLSQHGADYLAKQGWTYAQILANYYYGTTLVTGDTYPATINYAGTDYNTREYLASALETEMGGSFSKEALKAQAVALYTFAKYNNYRLNADANAYGKTASATCTEVVDEVVSQGLYLAYNGSTALTPFHSISAGKTTSYYNVWGGSQLPYLNGGRPSYGDYEVSDFKSTFTISSEEFKTIAQSKLGVTLTGDPASWIRIVSHDQAVSEDIGYVSTLNIGGKEVTGNEFRGKVMEGKIRSHCFMLVYTPTA
ncbi:MAG: hypothetical protein IJT41_08670 [Clostridia bacterium]|nr:hypothetical protein [Clostridia bacterium]